MGVMIEGMEMPNDCISREAVIEELNRLGRNAWKDDADYDGFFAFLDNLPPVVPTRKVGKWKEYPHEWGDNWQCSDYECSICYNRAHFDTDYCPNCGAEMESE